MARILIRRARPGLGDCLMSLVAVRAALEKYPPPDNSVIAAFPTLYYPTMYQTAMQMGCADCISPPDWSGLGDAAFIGEYAIEKFDRVIDLDGPEVEHAQQTNYVLTKNRIECFCDALGHRPGNMATQFYIDTRHRLELVDRYLRTSGLDPLSYIAIHYKSAEAFKDYPAIDDLICALHDWGVEHGHKIFVIHNGPVPDFQGRKIYYTSRLTATESILFLSMAKLLVCPDSSMLHAAAAVGCPTLALFSGTPGALTCKYYPLTTVLQNRDVSGQPCAVSFPCFGLHDRNYWCGEREDDEQHKAWCLEQITPMQIVGKVGSLLTEYAALNATRAMAFAKETHELRQVKIDRSRWPKDKKTLVVGVSPGIGDLVWPLMKARSIMAEDGADGIHLCIQKTQPARGREFAQRFSFVHDVTYCDFPIHPIAESHILSTGRYNYVPTQRNYLGMDWFWQANGHLEHGGNLADWMAEYPIDWHIARDWNFIEQDHRIADAVAQRIGRPYVAAFIGSLDGNSRVCHNRAASYTKKDWERFRYHPDLYDGIEARSPWRTKDWIELLGTIVREQGLRVCIVGARYDAEHGRHLKQAWVAAGYDPADMFDVSGQLHIAESYAVIMHANCRCLWSYQSGIGIHSVLLGANCAIWWRADGDSTEPAQNRLVSFDERMNFQWAPPWSLSSGSYMPLIYARETPRMLYDESVKRGWYDASRPRGWKALSGAA